MTDLYLDGLESQVAMSELRGHIDLDDALIEQKVLNEQVLAWECFLLLDDDEQHRNERWVDEGIKLNAQQEVL